jgi:hypothetical protein
LIPKSTPPFLPRVFSEAQTPFLFYVSDMSVVAIENPTAKPTRNIRVSLFIFVLPESPFLPYELS